ncbi:zinc-finger domain-containing protein [Bacillus tianshenii]|uniref:zinc-finger domain-containing protein n=1 Tax=Sutcliffiella tianshenii TaxID=1463404 RepID=UPI001EF8C7CC|nr:zinc-finger domain-containing protein [Bacillus tianshenii]
MINRKKILMEVGEILDTYCTECLVKQALRKDYGKNQAQSFCINECTVGAEIKILGDQLVHRSE